MTITGMLLDEKREEKAAQIEEEYGQSEDKEKVDLESEEQDNNKQKTHSSGLQSRKEKREDPYRYKDRREYVPDVDWQYDDEVEEAIINRYGEDYDPREVDPYVIQDDLESDYDPEDDGDYFDEDY